MTPYKHPTLGEVTIINSPRAKRLSLKIKASGEVSLVIPRGCSSNEALLFLEQKKEWVETMSKKLKERYPQQVISLPFSTKQHILQLNPCASNRYRSIVQNGIISISYPSKVHYEAPEVQDAIKIGIEKAWSIEAKKYLPERTSELAHLKGFKHKEVTVRNSKTRWGSCSARDSLSLSIHLMKLPYHLIDYVLLHELCHTRQKNHGPKFHELLNAVTNGEHNNLNKQLKAYSTRTYI